MIDPITDLEQLVGAAVRAAFGDLAGTVEPAVHRSEHADYQADVALALARTLRRSPREVATAIAGKLSGAQAIHQAVVSGPGFINISCPSAYLAAQLERMHDDERLGVERAAVAQTVVVDYSSPNLAKQMHVGHLRSTIIGDCLVRTLEYLGHRVIRQNHIGDWGTPFGMLIEHLLDCGSGTGGADLRELSAFYRAARVKFDTDETFAQRARHRVVRLQQGDVVTLELWGRLIDTTAVYMEALYARLHVTFGREHMVGESHYNAQLQQVVDELERSGLAQPSLKTAQLAGWAPAQVRLQHVAFGSVLGQDGKCSRRALERPSAWIS